MQIIYSISVHVKALQSTIMQSHMLVSAISVLTRLC